MKRFPWGHESRHCIRCGVVGPRIHVYGGWVHKYCLSDSERKKRDAEQRSKMKSYDASTKILDKAIQK